MKKVIIEQKGKWTNIEIDSLNCGDVELSQCSENIGDNLIVIKAISKREVAMAICPELETESKEKDEEIKRLREAALKLYDMVHESDLIQNKIKANELYSIISNE